MRILNIILCWMLAAPWFPAHAQGLTLLGAGSGSAPSQPGIQFINSCTGTTSCASVPAHVAGDLFLAYVGRDASTAAPTLPGGWTSVSTPSINGTSTADSVALLACKVAAGSSETITGFTNGANLVATIYRNTRQIGGGTCATDILGTPSNFTSTVNTTSTTVTYNSITTGDATSWVAGFAYTPAATAGLDTAPASMTNRALAGSTKAAAHDTNAAVASWTTANVTVTTAGRIITSTVEIKTPQAATPTFSPSSGVPPQSVTISSATTGSSGYIHYTTDGSTPTSGSTAGTSVSVTVDPTTVKAKVISLPGYSDSGVGSATYTASGITISNVGSVVQDGDMSPHTCTVSGITLATGDSIVALSATGSLGGDISATWNSVSLTQLGTGLNPGGNLETHFFRLNNVTGGTGDLVLTKTSSGDDGATFDCAGVRITGLTTHAEDKTASSSNAASVNWTTGATATTSTAVEGIVAMFAANTDTSTTIGTWQNSFTRLARIGQSTGGCCVLDYGYFVSSSAAAFTGAVNGNASVESAGYIVTFQ